VTEHKFLFQNRYLIITLDGSRRSDGQEITSILRNPAIHYPLHSGPLLVPIACQTHTYPTSLRSILILSSHLRRDLISGVLQSHLPIRTLYTRGAQIFQKSRSHFKITVVKMVTRSKPHTDDPLILGATVHNVAARNLCPTALHLLSISCMPHVLPILSSLIWSFL
jgi:hypothetical protein